MKPLLACIALCCGAVATPVLAASSTSSAASDSASSTASSASDSLQGSSNSSSKNNVAAGDYTVVEVLALADRPDHVRIKLQAVAGGGEAGAFSFYLVLPVPAFERSRLAPGETVVARARPYGLEFARADTQQAFFLVLDDAWHRELSPRAVVM